MVKTSRISTKVSGLTFVMIQSPGLLLLLKFKIQSVFFWNLKPLQQLFNHAFSHSPRARARFLVTTFSRVGPDLVKVSIEIPVNLGASKLLRFQENEWMT